MVPSESKTNEQYFVAAADDACSCSMKCSHFHCYPHMYNCSCIDFAVHATVCKHVHTIHTLSSSSRPIVASQIPTSHSNNLVADDQETNDLSDAMDTVEVPSSSVDQETESCETIRKQLISTSQQFMALATTCNNRTALQSLLTHIRTGLASARALARYQPESLPVSKKLPANRKLDRQHRFFSTKAKRRPLQQRLQKPATAEVTAIKRKLLCECERPTVTDSLNSNEFDLQLFSNSGCSDVPFCVDSEDVCASAM